MEHQIKVKSTPFLPRMISLGSKCDIKLLEHISHKTQYPNVFLLILLKNNVDSDPFCVQRRCGCSPAEVGCAAEAEGLGCADSKMSSSFINGLI